MSEHTIGRGHGHFVKRCRHGRVLTQCRCASPTKTVEIVPCPPRCSAWADPEPRPATRTASRLSLDLPSPHDPTAFQAPTTITISIEYADRAEPLVLTTTQVLPNGYLDLDAEHEFPEISHLAAPISTRTTFTIDLHLRALRYSVDTGTHSEHEEHGRDD